MVNPLGPTVGVSQSLPVRTQFLIFTLLGEYVMDRGGAIWTSSLLDLMGLLDVSERAVRSTLSRMVRKGWIRSQKHGRRSRYTVTGKGRVLFESGRQRIFEPVATNWDGQWHIVVYSLPEAKRRQRHALRTQLAWLGFGHLGPGTWFSPHSRMAELKSLFSDLGVEAHVDLFSGQYYGPSTAAELVSHGWDLDGLESQYQEFISRHEPDYKECLAQMRRKQISSPKEYFIKRFWLVHDFQSFPLRDPNLPEQLLPLDWIGFQARELFDNYQKLLGEPANAFVYETMNQGNTP